MYNITLYKNNKISNYKTNIIYENNNITFSEHLKVVNLLDDINIINNYIYNPGVFYDEKRDRNSCISNIITLDINNLETFDYEKLIDLLNNYNEKFLFYKTTNDNFRLLILLENKVMSDSYKIEWEKNVIKYNLVNSVNGTMKDISRIWFSTKKFITGNY